LAKLIQGVRPGDAVVFHFSGHGTQVLNSLLLFLSTQRDTDAETRERHRETDREGTQRE
jgi:hypothetical protein